MTTKLQPASERRTALRALFVEQAEDIPLLTFRRILRDLDAARTHLQLDRIERTIRTHLNDGLEQPNG
jgi:hypothetical protein